MSRQVQRELMAAVYQRWTRKISVDGMEACKSVVEDEINLLWKCGDTNGAYRCALTGVEEGYLQRDDDHSAMLIRRLAQHVVFHSDGPKDLLAQARWDCSDTILKARAEAYYQGLLANEEDSFWPNDHFLWPPN